MRVTLIHALRHSLSPIEEAFARLWPQAELRNLLDDSLSTDLARSGVADDRMQRRFLALGRYAAESRTDAILFTCSAFGACIDAVAADLAPLPVHKPTSAMIAQAAAMGGRVGVVASFEPTLSSLVAEFPAGLQVVPILARGALDALSRGDAGEHDRLVVSAGIAADVDIFALAQFSVARAAPQLRKHSGKPVLTTPDSAIRGLAAAIGVALPDSPDTHPHRRKPE